MVVPPAIVLITLIILVTSPTLALILILVLVHVFGRYYLHTAPAVVGFVDSHTVLVLLSFVSHDSP